MKKVISLFLSVAMLLSITAGFDLSVYAATSGDFEYEILEDETVRITEYTGSATDLTIPTDIDGYSVTSIGYYCFFYCKSLTSVIIPNSVISIGNDAFDNCTNLTSVTIGDSITSIGEYAFYNCDSLTSVTIPDSVISICEVAFYDCDSLTSVTIGNGVTSIGEGAFSDCDSLTSIDVDSQNQYYASQNGVLFNIEKTKLIQYPVGNTRTEYTIPSSVTSIGYDVFGYCDSLTSVTIGNSVTSIDNYAFYSCDSLTDVYYNSTIADWNSISIGDGNKDLTNATIHCSDGIIDEKTHTHSFVSEYTPPTCTQQGYTTHTCECGHIYTDNYVNAAGHSWDKGKVTKASTCTLTGIKTYTCTACGVARTEVVAKKAHTYKTYTTKATTNKNGSAVTKCIVCSAVKSKSTIYYPKTIKLSKTSYTYNGKVQTPSVTVKNSKGKTLKKNTDYTVKYAKGRKNVGKYAVKITFKGKYSGSKTLYYTIKPKATSISKLTAGKKKFTVKWKKLTTQTTGYQIQYSTSSKFKSAKTVTVSNNKTTSKTISKLKAKKKYYVRIRTYKTVGKTKYYSSWSNVKSVKTK